MCKDLQLKNIEKPLWHKDYPYITRAFQKVEARGIEAHVNPYIIRVFSNLTQG